MSWKCYSIHFLEILKNDHSFWDTSSTHFPRHFFYSYNCLYWQNKQRNNAIQWSSISIQRRGTWPKKCSKRDLNQTIMTSQLLLQWQTFHKIWLPNQFKYGNVYLKLLLKFKGIYSLFSQLVLYVEMQESQVSFENKWCLWKFSIKIFFFKSRNLAMLKFKNIKV